MTTQSKAAQHTPGPWTLAAFGERRFGAAIIAVTDKANRQFDNVIEDCGDPAWARLATHDEQNETERNGGC